MNIKNNLLPEPQRITTSEGFLEIPEFWQYHNAIESKRLNKALGNQYKAVPKFQAQLLIQNDTIKLPKNISTEKRLQAYQLTISASQVKIVAQNEHGAFLGLKTLEQLCNSSTQLPIGEIIDWPDLAIRGVHVSLFTQISTLSDTAPNYNTLVKLITGMARVKLNTLVLEYDNRFPWKKHSDICRDAFSKEELKALVEHAHNNFIDVIPLLDSLGHSPQYLQNEKYAYLRELPNNIAEMCPSNPETMKFIKELWEEVLDLHTDARYVHISGDEVFRLGNFCPKCQAYADQGKLAELYINYFTELAEWVIKHGKTPVVWGDMLIKYPELIDKFSREIVITDWSYLGAGEELNKPPISANPEGVCSQERQDLFSDYWRGSETGKYKVFPYFNFFTDHGFKSIAVTAASEENKCYFPISSFEKRFENNKNFALEAQAKGAGLITTFWNSCSGPLPGSWFGIQAAAEFSWHSRQESLENFTKRFVVSALDLPESFACKLFDFENAMQEETAFNQHLNEKVGSNADIFAQSFLELSQTNTKLLQIDKTLSELEDISFKSCYGGKYKVLDITSAANSDMSNCMSAETMGFEIPEGNYQRAGINFVVNKHALTVHHDFEFKAVKLGDHCNTIAFMSNTQYVKSTETAAAMKVKYTNGKYVMFDFTQGVDAGEWWGRHNLSKGLNIYHGLVEKTFPFSIYMHCWKNPYPDDKIDSIEFIPCQEKGRMIFYSMVYSKNYNSQKIVSNDISERLDRLGEIITGGENELSELYLQWMLPGSVKAAAAEVFSLRKERLRYLKNKMHNFHTQQ